MIFYIHFKPAGSVINFSQYNMDDLQNHNIYMGKFILLNYNEHIK